MLYEDNGTVCRDLVSIWKFAVSYFFFQQGGSHKVPDISDVLIFEAQEMLGMFHIEKMPL